MPIEIVHFAELIISEEHNSSHNFWKVKRFESIANLVSCCTGIIRLRMNVNDLVLEEYKHDELN